ncbi:MAG: VanZ family protein [Bacteroidota bacterium]
MKKALKFLFPIYLMAVIGLLVMNTSDSGIDLDFKILGINSDHWIHAIMFLPFMVFCRLLFVKEKFLIYLFLGIAFCSFCETLHYFIPYRTFSIFDFYANLTGLFVGSLSFLFSKKITN